MHRGPASALYGDTGLGGVVHLFTRPTDAAAATTLSASGGSWGDAGGELSHSGSFGRLSYSVSAGLRDVDGYRDRSAWTTRNLSASLQVDLSSASELVLSAASHDRESEEPGPLGDAQIEDDPRQADYPIDGEDDQRLAVSAHYARRFSVEARLTLDLSHRTKDSDLIRSLPLELQFDDMLVPSSDVKQRDLETRATILQAPYQHEIDRGGLRHRFALGFEAARGALDSVYREVTPALEIGMSVADGDGTRASYAVYAQDQVRLSSAVSLLAGVRYDRFEDEFAERLAENLDVDATHDALSPKLGVTWSYRPDGDLFAQVGRGFRAPTLDQLFDQRRPFGSNISNSGLEPQKATNYEFGLRQTFEQRVDVELTLYRLNLKKEIEFDPATFTFGNIGRSRHEGVELSAGGHLRPGLRAFVAYTLQDATHETSAVPDKPIVRAPRHLGSAGLRYALARGWSGSLTWRVVGRQFLDEANEVALDSYSTIGARLGYRFERVALFASFTNLLDRSFGTNGFVTPTTVIVPGAAVLGGTIRTYPAPELAVRVGLTRTIGGQG